VAEKTGAKSFAAQSRLELSRLDLEEDHAVQAEQPISDAIAVFAGEKMHDDELNGRILLSRCLMDQGKTEAAKAALNEIRKAVSSNQNPVNRLLFAIADAQIRGAGAASSRAEARSELQRSIKEAGNLGLVPLQMEAQLALYRMDVSENLAGGRKDLESLQGRAHAHGFESIARRAATLGARRTSEPAKTIP